MLVWKLFLQVTVFILVTVSIAEGISYLVARRQRLTGKSSIVEPEKCTGCMLCVRNLSCPSMIILDGKMVIDETTCDGCGLCSQLCPFHAISRWDKR